MAVHNLAGSKMFISPTAMNTDTVNAMSEAAALAFFEAINDWIEIEEIEDFGTIGDTMEVSTFVAVGNRRVRKLGSTLDSGTQEIVVGRDALDDGQEKLFEVMGNGFNYPLYVELNDARTPNHSKSLLYYGGMVLSKPTNMGNVSNVVKRNVSLGLNTAIYEVGTAVLAAPVNTVLPAVSGIVATGEVLTAFPGTWTNSPTLTYQWQADDAGNDTFVDISGATSQTFTAVVGNEGDALRVKVTGVNGEGTPVVAFSAPTQLQTA